MPTDKTICVLFRSLMCSPHQPTIKISDISKRHKSPPDTLDTLDNLKKYYHMTYTVTNPATGLSVTSSPILLDFDHKTYAVTNPATGLSATCSSISLACDHEYAKASGIKHVTYSYFLDKTHVEKKLEEWHKKQAKGGEYEYQGCKGVWNFYELKEWDMGKEVPVNDGKQEGTEKQETKEYEETWVVVDGKGEGGETGMSGNEEK
jgi:hypothetical protein